MPELKILSYRLTTLQFDISMDSKSKIGLNRKGKNASTPTTSINLTTASSAVKILLAFIVIFASAQATAHSDNELKIGYGYLLIEVDASGIAPSIEYQRLSRPNKGRTEKINLKNIKDRFLLLPVRNGKYKVTRVNAPFFQLPNYKHTGNSSRWHFEVQKGKINYFGLIQIKKERLKDFVYIERKNRLATTLEDITSKFHPLLKKYPLVNAIGYKDEFLKNATSLK